MAIAGLVLGIIGLVLCWIIILGSILALLGVIFGALGIVASKKRGGAGKGAAIAGLALGIVGLVASIVLPMLLLRGSSAAFSSYMEKSREIEGKVNLDRIGRSVKAFYAENADLPPSSGGILPGPASEACQQPSKKFPPATDKWMADPAFDKLAFSVDEPSAYAYDWVRESATAGHATAYVDRDCDGTPSARRLDVTVVAGNVQTSLGASSPD
ncbi:MAG: DUF4190 domain-containing protein [Proteobacteria bacterium]|nr:DUF4190 domain-containing protein [Pseudomonadota bacterium]